MNITDILSAGGFVDSDPVKIGVVWKSKDKTTGKEIEHKFDIFVLRQSWGVMEKLWSSGEDKSRSASYISNSIRLGDSAEQSLSYDQAYNLDPSLASVFLNAINDVNNASEKKAKN